MTRKEAENEARRRWGNDAGVWNLGPQYAVGVVVDGILERKGSGRLTWEAAFADADTNERGQS